MFLIHTVSTKGNHHDRYCSSPRHIHRHRRLSRHRRVREAVLGTDGGWPAALNAKVTALRAQLTPTAPSAGA